jgi:hypothetical protein
MESIQPGRVTNHPPAALIARISESGDANLQIGGLLGAIQENGAPGLTTRDIRTAVSHAISEMSLTDGLDLVDQAFAAVGIGK